MKKFFPVAALALAFAASVFSQDIKPVPSSTPPADNDVVKISTNLVQVDVTVTDKKGKIVRDLRPDEIEIYQNGKKQDISNFSFISNTREISEGQKTTAPQAGIPLPPTRIRAENVKRTIALVVDDLTLSFESTYYVRRALKKFVDEQMQDGDLVAIIRTGAGIGVLQQFTNDKRQLYAAIEKVKWNALGSGKIGAFAPLEAKLNTGEPTPTPAAGERSPEGIEREFNDFRSDVFATGSLGAVNYIVGGMAELPGRKSIMLLSDGFKLATTNAEGFNETGRVLDAVRSLVEKANRSSVVIYTMDPRGLVYTGLNAADDTGGRTQEEIQTAESDRRGELSDTQDGLRYLARETGGFALINNNDLSGGIRRVLDDQSYYLVGYNPDDETFDPKKLRFNKLSVRVTRKDVNVRYRSGFFSVEDKTVAKTAVVVSPIARLQKALSSPFSVSGIDLRLNALFLNDATNGSLVRSLLHIDAGDLTFTEEKDGVKKAAFDLIAMSFGDNGQVVSQLGQSYTLTVKPEMYKKIVADGFVYQFTFPVKKAGAYQYRVAIRDPVGDKVGSASQFIDVPNLKKNRLTISGVVIQNLSAEEWQKSAEGHVSSDPMTDTALRRVHLGSVLRFAYEIYNAKLDPAKQPKLTAKVRVFKDGQLLFDGNQSSIALASGQIDMQRLKAGGAISLGNKMELGDYVLQVVVTDTLAKTKQQIATQFVQFEVVE